MLVLSRADFGVLQLLGRTMGGWIEAALWSMTNCFVVPFWPGSWAQVLRMQDWKEKD